MFDRGFNIDSFYHMIEYIENQLDNRDHCLLYKSQKMSMYARLARVHIIFIMCNFLIEKQSVHLKREKIDFIQILKIIQ